MNDKEYLAAIHDLPCAICHLYRETQLSPTQAHHTFCGRYSRKRATDKDAIPLCHGHHQGDMDTTKIAIHRRKKTWVERYGPDTDYIEWTRKQITGC